MNPEISRALVAIVLAADSPVESQLLAQLVELSVEEVEEVLASLAATYVEQRRGFQLVRVAGGDQKLALGPGERAQCVARVRESESQRVRESVESIVQCTHRMTGASDSGSVSCEASSRSSTSNC